MKRHVQILVIRILKLSTLCTRTLQSHMVQFCCTQYVFCLSMIIICDLYFCSTIIPMLVAPRRGRQWNKRLVSLCQSSISSSPVSHTVMIMNCGHGAARPQLRPYIRPWGRHWNMYTLHYSSLSVYVCIFSLILCSFNSFIVLLCSA